MSLQVDRCRPCRCRAARWSGRFSTRAGDRERDDERRRHEEVRLEVRMDARLEVAVADSTAAQTRSLFVIASFDLGRRGRRRCRCTSCSRSATTSKPSCSRYGSRPVLRQVVGDDARAGRERGLDVRLDREALLDGLLREQAGGEQHARVRRVRARRDRGDQHVAVADRRRRSRRRGATRIGRRTVVDHLDDVARLRLRAAIWLRLVG